MVPFFSYLSKFRFFDTLYEKLCHSWNIIQKENNLWQWIDKYVIWDYEAYHVTDFSNITS